MLADKTLTILDQNNKEIVQKPFPQIVAELVYCADACKVDIEKAEFALGYLPIYFRGDAKRIKGDRFLLDIFKLISEMRNIHGENFGWPWLWLYIGSDYVIDDAMSEYYDFMICNNGKIMKEFVNVYNIPDGFFQEAKDFFFRSDDRMQQAKIRMYYESFYRETSYGKMLMSSFKNDRDIELFGQIQPGIEDLTFVQLPKKIDRLIEELKSFKRLLVWIVIVFTILIIWLKFH